jgi:hypothetical protein
MKCRVAQGNLFKAKGGEKMLETPLWVKILFTLWIIVFIMLEAGWETIFEWVGNKYRTFTQNLHVGKRPKGRAGA